MQLYVSGSKLVPFLMKMSAIVLLCAVLEGGLNDTCTKTKTTKLIVVPSCLLSNSSHLSSLFHSGILWHSVMTHGTIMMQTLPLLTELLEEKLVETMEVARLCSRGCTVNGCRCFFCREQQTLQPCFYRASKLINTLGAASALGATTGLAV